MATQKALETMVLAETVLLNVETEREHTDEQVNLRYNRIAQRAEAGSLVILNVSQSTSLVSHNGNAYMLIVILASVTTKENVERMQRQAQISGGGFSGNGRGR